MLNKNKVTKKEDKKRSDIEVYNESIMTLATEVSNSINNYLKRGYVNLASVMGILEDMKNNVSDIARKQLPSDRVTFQEKKPNYIG